MERAKLNIQKFASGSFEFPNWTGNYAIRGKIEWSSTSSIDENKSVVTASIYVRRTSGYTTGKLWNGYVNIGGNNHTYSQIYTGTSTTVRQDWVLVQTFSDTILHNADGTKTINISGQVTGPSGTGLEGKSSWGDSNVTLDTIPRASQPTLSSSSVTMGNSVTITTNRVSNSFTHTISYSFGSATGTIATNVGDSTTWTPPVTLSNQIPNSASGSCTIICQTYNGTTLIGTKQVSLTLNVPSSVVPTVSIGTLTEANAAMQTLNWGVFVQNKSQLNIPITASGSYGSSISSIVTTINGLSFTGSPVTTSTLITSGTNTISTTVTDTRGRTATTTKTYTVVEYSNPQITTATCVRSLSDGTESDEGTYLKYSFVGSISSASNHNAHNFKIGYKLKSGSTYTYTDIDTTNYSINKVDQVLNLNLDTNNAYDIIFVVTDTFTSSSITRAIETGFDLMNFNASGKSMAIGKVSEASSNEELLELGMNTDIDGDININGNLEMNGTPTMLAGASGDLYIGANNNNLILRPKGVGTWQGQTYFKTDGSFEQNTGVKTFSSGYDNNYYWCFNTDAGEFQFNKQIVPKGIYLPGNDMVLACTTGTNDSSDIVWLYGNGSEKARIWASNELSSGSPFLNYRTYDQNGNQLFSTQLAPVPVILYDSGGGTTGVGGGNYLTIDNLSTYKKLQITFTMYRGTTTNTGGFSNICWLDLTRNNSNLCRSGIAVPYFDGNMASASSGNLMGSPFVAIFEANLSNNRLYCLFGYNTEKKINDGYYLMTKVVGYKY